jgi:hypothetical protein
VRINKAIRLLQEEYEKAKKQNWIHNPLAYALYQVWRMADADHPTEKGGGEGR